MDRLRIAVVSPLHESVPPRLYGGTERVVAYLVDELVRQGQDVTLFATGDSRTRAHLRPMAPRGLRLDPDCRDPVAPHVAMLHDVIEAAGTFDVIHFNIDYLHFPAARALGLPAVTTVHGRLDLDAQLRVYRRYRDMPLVSISRAQRCGCRWSSARTSWTSSRCAASSARAAASCSPRKSSPTACCSPTRASTASRGAPRSRSRARRGACRANAQFNAWIERSAADLGMLTAGNPEGPYPYAGVPWYSVPFGRDGIITALEYLWADAAMAREVLAFLARTQATERRAEQDAEPGKIVHEMRKGELAALGEIPFGTYYGTIDATPLFIVLAGEYQQRTGDTPTLERLWPALLAALEWIDRHGDLDGDGYVEYRRHSDKGLVNQGWKDSEDSVFHADGSPAHGPIALCEVQAYVYLAKIHAARLARLLGEHDRASELERSAEALRNRFELDFWCDELGTYALALDGDKRPCRVRSSNAGHVLWSGIASEERARRVGEALMSPESFSGWGVRTVTEGQARYGMKDKTAAVAAALYEASLFMDLHRLPELFCGFERRHAGEGPTLYPVACSPQAWASAAPFYLIKACLGLSFRPQEPRIRFLHPVLPPFLDSLRLTDLRVGEAVVDVLFERHGGEIGVKVARKQGDVEVSVVL